jgi:hypothetical protein
LLAAGLAGFAALPATAQSQDRRADASQALVSERAAQYDGRAPASQAALPYDGPVATTSSFRLVDCEAGQTLAQNTATAAYSQGNTAATGGGAQEVGQSFTAPCDGEMSSFEFIYQSRPGGAGLEADLAFTVYGGAGTASAPLATVTRTITTEPEGSAYSLLFELDEPVPVAEGSVYTVFLDNTNDTNINIQGANPGPYEGGSVFVSSTGSPEGAGPVAAIDLRFTATFQPGDGGPDPTGGITVADSSFEAGVPNPVWFTNTPGYLGGSPVFGTPRNPDIPEFARTGVWYALLGTGGPVESDVYQDIEVPAAGTDSLRFWLFAGLNPDSESELNIYIDDDLLDTIDAEEAADYGDYTELAYEYTFEEAGTYRIRFQQTQPTAEAPFINWFIDDVTFGEGAPPPPPPTGVQQVTLENEEVSLGLYADAEIGTDAGADFAGPGFVFDGLNGLFSSIFVAGTSPTSLSGSAYDTDSDWVSEAGIIELEEAPEGYSAAYELTFTDDEAESPLGLSVTLRALVPEGDASGVVLEYMIMNANEEGTIEDLYAGIFADYDVGAGTDYEQNLADFYQSGLVGLNHVWLNGGGSNSNYYGTALLNEQASGYAFDQAGSVNDGEIWEGLTEMGVTPDTPGDRRTTTGAGPYDIAAGESVTVRFAMVAGTDAADIIANAEELAARFFEPVAGNGIVSTEFYANGSFGAIGGEGEGFVFDGANGLYSGQFVVSLVENEVFGEIYGDGELETIESVRPVPVSSPFAAAFRSVYGPESGEFTVIEEAFIPEGVAAVIYRYTIKNTSGDDLDDIYVGSFADYDIGPGNDFALNVGGYDAANGLVYVSNSNDPESDFFGIIRRGDMPAGWATTVGTPSGATDAEVYQAMTTPGMMDEEPADRRALLGDGPFSLAPNERVSVSYAVVAGQDLTDITNTAITAGFIVLPEVIADSVEDPAGEVAAEMGLRVFPNPVAGQATVAFRAPVGTDARVTVFDVLGREVLRVADQQATDAEQRVQLSTSALPAGVYLVRLQAGDVTDVQQITVVR